MIAVFRMKELRRPPVDNDWRMVVCGSGEAWKKRERVN
jgi:hypothetical protein